jgi:hypothetical protein
LKCCFQKGRYNKVDIIYRLNFGTEKCNVTESNIGVTERPFTITENWVYDETTNKTVFDGIIIRRSLS